MDRSMTASHADADVADITNDEGVDASDNEDAVATDDEDTDANVRGWLTDVPSCGDATALRLIPWL